MDETGVVCYICLDDMSPSHTSLMECSCRGTSGHVHDECLFMYITSPEFQWMCPMCQHGFLFETRHVGSIRQRMLSVLSLYLDHLFRCDYKDSHQKQTLVTTIRSFFYVKRKDGRRVFSYRQCLSFLPYLCCRSSFIWYLVIWVLFLIRILCSCLTTLFMLTSSTMSLRAIVCVRQLTHMSQTDHDYHEYFLRFFLILMTSLTVICVYVLWMDKVFVVIWHPFYRWIIVSQRVLVCLFLVITSLGDMLYGCRNPMNILSLFLTRSPTHDMKNNISHLLSSSLTVQNMSFTSFILPMPSESVLFGQ